MRKIFLSLGTVANLLAAPAATIAEEDNLPIVAANELPKSISEISLQKPSFDQPQKSVAGAVALSWLVPGLGHIYLGEQRTAETLLGSYGLESSFAFSRNPNLSTSSVVLLLNTWFYGVFSAYRDARNLNGNSGYQYEMPNDNLSELVFAPISYSVMKKPEVWGALLVELAAAFGIGCLWTMDQEIPTKSVTRVPILALPIAIGEESFFRGFAQPVFSEAINPTGGLVISSLLFGAAHIGNAYGMEREQRRKYFAYSLPFITLSGFYDGYLAQKNHSIKETVALHAWYDFVLFSGAYLLSSRQSITGPQSFAVSIPF